MRSLVGLLDEWLPIVAGSEILDDPYHPVSRYGRELVAAKGDDCPIEWVGRDQRFGEKLATPDTSIADLIGEVDPVKVAEGRYLSDELTLHYGLGAPDQPGDLRHQRAARPGRADPGRPPQRPRGAGRPDPRVQNPPAARRDARGLGQPRGLHEPRPDHHPAQGPLRRTDPDPLPARHRDRGRRSSSKRPRWPSSTSVKVEVPPYMADVVASISQLARQSPQVNQRSGVSVRLGVANYETLVAAAARDGPSAGRSQRRSPG